MDRYVRRGRLGLSAEAPRQKLAFLAEESLRLCSLPGEAEGRVYHFQRLHVQGLSENDDRTAWLSAFQNAIERQASLAIHGSDPRAAGAEAVYFRSQQEACETFLALIAARNAPTAWYWPHIIGLPAAAAHKASMPQQVARVVEKLLATPAGWMAVATAVLSAASQSDVITVIKLLPDEMIAHWLSQLGGTDSAYAAPVRFSDSVTSILMRAIAALGANAPAVLWLASLAVIRVLPASAENRSAVRVAKASLRKLIAESAIGPAGAIWTETSPEACEANTVQPAAPEALSQVPASAWRPAENRIVGKRSVPQALRDEFCFGEPTSGAGLYFLVNALRYLQVEQQHFSLAFLARLFLRIAQHSGIEAGDPILLWAEVTAEQSGPEPIDDRLLRVWLLKVRRWCWRTGRISMRDIVRRPGYVTLTRTDLDVTLAIDSADVRIRRIGLDLDPGWVPWFGRVVHFHYRYRGEIHG
jgi:hypothetical protein